MTVGAFSWAVGRPSEATSRDLRQDQRVMLVASGTVGGLFAVATSVQSVLAMGVFSSTLRGVEASPVSEIVVRAAINVGTVALMLVVVAMLHPERRPFGTAVGMSAAIVVGAGVVRAAVQLLVGVYSGSNAWIAWAEVVTTSVACAITLLIGFALVGVWRRLRTEERQRLQSQLEALLLYRELQEEELRVRREVAQGIHGGVQGAFVMLEADLLDVAPRVNEESAARLRRAAETVRDLRERELRELSGVLYPVDLDRGLDAALTALLMRLPAHVAVTREFAAAARSLDERADALPFSTRLLLVRIVEEALTNALRHGRATAVRVSLSLPPDAEARAIVVVEDDGSGVADGATWSGLHRLERHLDLLAGSLRLSPSARLGGAELTAVVPIGVEPAAA